ncbi:hypothetical protein OF846_003323 [Rhodotorula toruloides]|nr:hypothetical protein OF846_003323 [Rhodotorula toruloides]
MSAHPHLARLYDEEGHTDEGLQKCIEFALSLVQLYSASGRPTDTAANGARHEDWLKYASGPASALLALFRTHIVEWARLPKLEKLQVVCAAYLQRSGSFGAPPHLFPSAKPFVDLLDGKTTTLVVDPHNHSTYYGPMLAGYDQPEEKSRGVAS